MLKASLLPSTIVSLLLHIAFSPAIHLVAAAPAPAGTTIPSDFTDYYRSTAPSPEDGPPASANASREKSILPYQITGVVGGYVVTVLIWGILLLTVGRRMRRKTENSSKTLELELVTKRPEERLVSPVPASPASARSATSWFKKGFRKDRAPSIQEVSAPQSPASFDQAVLDADRARAQEEMERLYAAVMDHDRKKSMSQASATSHDDVRDSRRPSSINTNQNYNTSHSNPSSPMKAIYPPNFSQNGPPTAPLPSSQQSYRRPSLQAQEPASPRSVLSKRSATSTSSKPRFNLKNLRISGPIAKYPNDGDDDARTPLSPRFYNPGAPPSPPTQQNSPTTPADIEEAYERLDAVQPLPRPAPQRTISISSSNAPTPTSATPQYPQQQQQQPRSAASSNTNLPFRSYAEPLKSPDLRTTVLDRRVDRLGMASPRTGVPFTPYSPYMPFTPITPVTPHLVTKRDRKQAKKYEGEAVKSGRDMVQSPKEIFGDAW